MLLEDRRVTLSHNIGFALILMLFHNSFSYKLGLSWIITKENPNFCGNYAFGFFFYDLIWTFLHAGTELLNLASQVDPGHSKWRGQLLHDLQATSAELARRALQQGKIDQARAKVHAEISCILFESSRYLNL